MSNMKALFLALLVLLVSGSAAFAQPLSDVATYTNWSLANSINPFYTDGRKGITHEEAARLPVGTLIALPDGTTRALKRGETVWQIDREYAVGTPIASRATQSTNAPAPHVEKTTRTAAAPAAKPTAPGISASALEQAKIQVRYEAERQTALLAEEALALREQADTNLALTSGATKAAFAATKKRKAREQIEFAERAAAMTRTNAQRAHNVATVAEQTAQKTDSAKADKNAARARADAAAAAVLATKAETLAKRAPTALAQWVWDFTPLLIALAIAVSVLAYVAVTALAFRFRPSAYNFVFRAAIESDSPVFLPVKLLAVPGFLVGKRYTDAAFNEEHYPYLDITDETSDRDEEETVLPEAAQHACAFAYAADVDYVPEEDEPVIEEERRFSPYPTDTRVELHQVLH